MGKRRRGRGEGSIEDLGNGRFRVVLSFGIDPATGKRRKVSKTLRSKAEAVAWRDKQKQDGPAGAGTLGDWLDTWLALHKADTAASTYAGDAQTVEKHVRPGIGHVPLAKLDQIACRRFLAALVAAGVTQTERHKAGKVLRRLLNAAVDAGKFARSPMHRVKVPPEPRSERTALTPAELAALLAAAESVGWGWVFRLWVDTGVRPAELLGLRWGDWDGKKLHVKRAVCKRTGAVKDLKTRGSVRSLPVSAGVAADLDGERPKGVSPDAPIVHAHVPKLKIAGLNHYRTDNFSRRVFQVIRDAAGVPAATGYTLRHTMASVLLSAGHSVRAVAARLGHGDASLTLRVYAHAMPDDQDRLADAMGAVLRTAAVPRADSERADTTQPVTPQAVTDGPRETQG